MLFVFGGPYLFSYDNLVTAYGYRHNYKISVVLRLMASLHHLVENVKESGVIYIIYNNSGGGQV